MKALLLGVIGVTATALVVLFLAEIGVIKFTGGEPGQKSAVTEDETAAIEKRLKKVITDLKASLPKPIGKNSVMTDVTVNGRILTYEVQMKTTSAELEALDFKTRQREALRETVCVEPSMVASIKNGVVFIYRYFDIEGTHVQTFTYSAAECGISKE